MDMSRESKIVAAFALILVPTIEYGGSFLLKSLSDPAYTANPLRHDLFRAGHAHAGVIIILTLVCQLLLDGALLRPALKWAARLGVPIAALLMSGGFFLSAVSPSVSQPGKLIVLVYVGAVVLAGSVLLTAVGLLRSAMSAGK
jgi:hypothetical protein